MRSRAAASILARAGFREVHSLAGGINAWNGLKAEGLPDTSWFAGAETPAQTLALAWLLEDGTRQFYTEVATRLDDPQTAGIFSGLVQAEVKHERMLETLWKELTGAPADPDPPRAALTGIPAEPLLENGLSLADGLRWCEGKSPAEILDLAMALETAAYDRYLRMFDETPMAESRHIFLNLAEEEKAHLRRLGEEIDRLLG